MVFVIGWALISVLSALLFWVDVCQENDID